MQYPKPFNVFVPLIRGFQHKARSLQTLAFKINRAFKLEGIAGIRKRLALFETDKFHNDLKKYKGFSDSKLKKMQYIARIILKIDRLITQLCIWWNSNYYRKSVVIKSAHLIHKAVCMSIEAIQAIITKIKATKFVTNIEYSIFTQQQDAEINRQFSEIQNHIQVMIAPPKFIIKIDGTADSFEYKATQDSVQTQFYTHYELYNSEVHAQHYIVPLKAGQILTPHALYEFASAIQQYPDADVLTANADIIKNGRRIAIELIEHSPTDYVICYRASIIDPNNTAHNTKHITKILGHKIFEGSNSNIKLSSIWPKSSQLYTLPQSILTPKNSKQSIAVAYLARGADKNHLQSFIRFRDSYRHHPAGIQHNFYIIFKGFKTQTALTQAQALFEEIPHTAVHLEDKSFDIGAYSEWATQISEDKICVLNTTSEILSDHWLKKLNVNLDLPDVGLVGATASFESLHDYFYYFPSFPNIHIRSNAFMMRRALFNAITKGLVIKEKDDALRFESGEDSLTRKVLAAGLKLAVVGRNGRGYAPDNWKYSETFRLGMQPNLLIADNQTRHYMDLSSGQQHEFAVKTWGKI